MNYGLRKILTMGALALVAMGVGVKTAGWPSATPVAASHASYGAAAPAHQMLADGDIGDGTSPTKKG